MGCSSLLSSTISQQNLQDEAVNQVALYATQQCLCITFTYNAPVHSSACEFAQVNRATNISIPTYINASISATLETCPRFVLRPPTSETPRHRNIFRQLQQYSAPRLKMGKGRNKKRANNRAQRVHERSVRDYEHERNTQPPDQWLTASNDLFNQGLRRSNYPNAVRPRASSRHNGVNDHTTTQLPTPNIDELFGQILEIIAEGLESWAATLRAQNTLGVGGDQLTTPYNIENLPTREITTNDQGEEDGEATCHVCQEDVEVGTVVTWLPKCQHWFCTECLEPWLKDHNTCPTCREVIE